MVRGIAEAIRSEGALCWTTRYGDDVFVGLVLGDPASFCEGDVRDALAELNPLLVLDMRVAELRLPPGASEDRLLDDLADGVQALRSATMRASTPPIGAPVGRLPETEVEGALAMSHLRLVAQDVHDLATLVSTGEPEVFVRLARDGALAAPASFLTVFGRCGMAARLDAWVIGESLRWLRSSPGGPSNRVSINVSGDSLADARFPEALEASVRAEKLSPASVALEVSESTLASDFVGTKRIMDALVSRGFGVVLDDAGTTWLPASKLATLPLSSLKIYGGLVRDSVEGPEASKCLRRIELIASVGAAIGANVVAKSIERFEWTSKLLAVGITMGQGVALSPTFPVSK
jgi:EAL domain-containing protein (putative c-di-GMP-specific phosphodiesterase class I)